MTDTLKFRATDDLELIARFVELFILPSCVVGYYEKSTGKEHGEELQYIADKIRAGTYKVAFDKVEAT